MDRTLLRELADQPDTQRWAANVAEATAGEVEANGESITPTPSQQDLGSSAPQADCGELSEPAKGSSEQDKPDSAKPSLKRATLYSFTISIARRLRRVLRSVRLRPNRVQNKGQDS